MGFQFFGDLAYTLASIGAVRIWVQKAPDPAKEPPYFLAWDGAKFWKGLHTGEVRLTSLPPNYVENLTYPGADFTEAPELLPAPDGLGMIAAERRRQRGGKYPDAHDDAHTGGEMLSAAVCFAQSAGLILRGSTAAEARAAFLAQGDAGQEWPFEDDALTVDADPLESLAKAGAMIAAEIDRIKRRRAAGLPDMPPDLIATAAQSRPDAWPFTRPITAIIAESDAANRPPEAPTVTGLRTPEGFSRMEAWRNGDRVVLLGWPEKEKDEDSPVHDCDYMGCGSFGNHVLGRVKLSELQTPPPNPTAYNMVELHSAARHNLDSVLNSMHAAKLLYWGLPLSDFLLKTPTRPPCHIQEAAKNFRMVADQLLKPGEPAATPGNVETLGHAPHELPDMDPPAPRQIVCHCNDCTCPHAHEMGIRPYPAKGPIVL